MLKIDANPNLASLLIAGRRAALCEMIAVANATPNWTYEGAPFESMVSDAMTRIVINGIDLTSSVDAAIVETLAWTAAPAAEKKRWWRFWA